MHSFASLPVQIQKLCTQYVDVKTVKALRLVTKAIGDLAAQRLFKRLTLSFTDESVANFENVLKSDTLRPLLTSVFIDGFYGSIYESDSKDEDQGQNQAGEDDDHHHPPRPYYEHAPWSLAIPKIALFPAVKAVKFLFDDECGFPPRSSYQDVAYRRFYQELLWRTLEEATSVDTLVMCNVQDALVSCVPSMAVRHRLRKLTLMVINERARDADGSGSVGGLRPHLVECLNPSLRTFWLEPMQNSLTHLALSFDVDWGVHPFADLRRLFFPHLRELALRHLRGLRLDGCTVAYALRGLEGVDECFPGIPDRGDIREVHLRWSDIFAVFEARLERLEFFEMQWSFNFGVWDGDDKLPPIPENFELAQARYIAYMDRG